MEPGIHGAATQKRNDIDEKSVDKAKLRLELTEIMQRLGGH